MEASDFIPSDDTVDGRHDDSLRRLDKHPTRFVGRQDELNLLGQTFSDVLNADLPSQFVAVGGYPGVGKSRLMYTFSTSASVRENALYCHGKCDDSRRNEPFSMLRDVFQDFARVFWDVSVPIPLLGVDGDSESERRTAIVEAVRRAVGPVGSAVLAQVVPALSGFLGINVGTELSHADGTVAGCGLVANCEGSIDRTNHSGNSNSKMNSDSSLHSHQGLTATDSNENGLESVHHEGRTDKSDMLDASVGDDDDTKVPPPNPTNKSLNENPSATSNSTNTGTSNFEAAQDRINHLFRALVRAITKHVPLIIFSDDLQWADAASLRTLCWLAIDAKISRLFLIAAYRDHEVTQHDKISTSLHGIQERKPGSSFRSFSLQALERTDLCTVLADVLQTTPESMVELSAVIYAKTEGNVFFALQFLESLQHSGLLVYSDAESRWQWAHSARLEADTDISGNVADLLAKKLQNLPEPLQNCLKVTACLSWTWNLPLLRQLFVEMADTLFIDLDTLSDLHQHGCWEGLFAQVETGSPANQFRYSHDRIREAAYALIGGHEEREHFHYKIGVALQRIRDDPSMHQQLQPGSTMVFLVTDQLQKGKAFIQTEAGLLNLVALNLESGQKAMSLAAFVPAARYLENGLALVDCIEGACTRHHHLVLSVVQCLAEVSWIAGEPTRSEFLAKLVISKSTSEADQLRASITLARTLGSQFKHREAIDVEVGQLVRLGVMPRFFRAINAVGMMMTLWRKLRGMAFDDTLALPQCSDQRIMSALDLLLALSTDATYHGDDILQTLSVCLMVKLTLKHGIYKPTLCSLSTFGAMIIVFFGDYAEAYRLGRITTRFMEQTQIQDVPASFLIWGYLNSWFLPLEESINNMNDVYELGMEKGQVNFAFLAFAMHFELSFQAGHNLEILREETEEYVGVLEEYGSEAVLPSMHCLARMIGTLSDRSPPRKDEDPFREEEFKEANENGHISVFSLYKYKMMTNFYLGDFETSYRCLEQTLKRGKTAVAYGDTTNKLLFDALVPLSLAKATLQPRYVRHAKAAVRRLQDVIGKAEGLGVNLIHLVKLFEADLLALKNRPDAHGTISETVSEAYYEAIKAAIEKGFHHDAALAHQCTGEYFQRAGDEDKARQHLSSALQLFEEWGAHSVVVKLRDKHSTLFSYRSGTVEDNESE